MSIVNLAAVFGQTDHHITWLNTHATIGINTHLINDWQAMVTAAEQAGFTLTIASGFRSFERQLAIWNRKFSMQAPVYDIENIPVDMATLSDKEKIQAIMLFSALPGASRHHWGTDIDVYASNLLPENTQLQLQPWEYQSGGPFAELSTWLQQNIQQFGFYFPYDQYRGGVAAEPWHISHHVQAATFSQQLTVENLATLITNSNILGKSAILDNLEYLFGQYIVNIGKN